MRTANHSDRADRRRVAGETITGGPVETLDLMEILSRPARGVTRGGAVSRADQPMVIHIVGRSGLQRAIALSDGSRISFASIEES